MEKEEGGRPQLQKNSGGREEKPRSWQRGGRELVGLRCGGITHETRQCD
jgi:hypothetical protein